VKLLQLDLSDNSALRTAAESAAEVLKGGGIVLYPSDTVYGLMCSAMDPQAVDRIREAKGSEKGRPFILLVSGVPMASRISDCTDPEVLGILNNRWPGRLTLVLPARANCPVWVSSAAGTVAVRHPADPLSQEILRLCDFPLVSTSANRAGEEPVLDDGFLSQDLIQSANLVLLAGQLPPSAPSTILQLLRSGSGSGPKHG